MGDGSAPMVLCRGRTYGRRPSPPETVTTKASSGVGDTGGTSSPRVSHAAARNVGRIPPPRRPRPARSAATVPAEAAARPPGASTARSTVGRTSDDSARSSRRSAVSSNLDSASPRGPAGPSARWGFPIRPATVARKSAPHLIQRSLHPTRRASSHQPRGRRFGPTRSDPRPIGALPPASGGRRSVHSVQGVRRSDASRCGLRGGWAARGSAGRGGSGGSSGRGRVQICGPGGVGEALSEPRLAARRDDRGRVAPPGRHRRARLSSPRRGEATRLGSSPRPSRILGQGLTVRWTAA